MNGQVVIYDPEFAEEQKRKAVCVRTSVELRRILEDIKWRIEFLENQLVIEKSREFRCQLGMNGHSKEGRLCKKSSGVVFTRMGKTAWTRPQACRAVGFCVGRGEQTEGQAKHHWRRTGWRERKKRRTAENGWNAGARSRADAGRTGYATTFRWGVGKWQNIER